MVGVPRWGLDAGRRGSAGVFLFEGSVSTFYLLLSCLWVLVGGKCSVGLY